MLWDNWRGGGAGGLVKLGRWNLQTTRQSITRGKEYIYPIKIKVLIKYLFTDSLTRTTKAYSKQLVNNTTQTKTG